MSNTPLYNKIIVICGQTGTGKSDLAVILAQKYNGEVISADSRQVYKNLDVSSGKLSATEMKHIPHHMIDIVDLFHNFSVAEYKEQAQKVIADIHARNKVAIICGGTGQYIQALTTDYSFPAVLPNPQLRAVLEQKSNSELFTLLIKKDPARAETIDQHNKVRLIRALEIIDTLGHVPKSISNHLPLSPVPDYQHNMLFIGLCMPKEELIARIQKRIDTSLDSIIEELEHLHEQEHIPWDRLERLGLWPALVSNYIQKKISYPELVRDMNTQTWQYAKRQQTWFKRDARIRWFHPLHDRENIIETTGEFLDYLKLNN